MTGLPSDSLFKNKKQKIKTKTKAEKKKKHDGNWTTMW